MTSTSSLITPPPEELLDKWEGKWHHYQGQYSYEMFMAEQAAQWGADQELEACYYWIENYHGTDAADSLQHARRPRPPTELPVLTPGYIDFEHTGQDREILDAFYRACNSEGGTADEIHLRGIRAVLERWGKQ